MRPALLPIFLRLYRRNAARLLFFSVCIAVGAAFLFAVGNLLAAVDRAVSERARELLAADVEIASNRPFDAEAQRILDKLAAEGVRRTPIISFSSMVHGDTITTPILASVKAVEPAYPFYGQWVVDPPDYADRFFGKNACLVDEQLALRFALRPGARLRLGRAELTVVGIVRSEPDRGLTAFNLGPRLFVPKSILARTGLIRFGARIRHRVHLAAPPSADPGAAARALAARLEGELKDPYLSIQSFAASRPTIHRVLERVTMFFVLIALIALMLGGVGMSASLTMFLNEQLETVGILRCLGLSPRHVARLYYGLCLAVGVQGGLLGALAGWLLSSRGLDLLTRWLGLRIDIAAAFSWPALWESLAIAVLLAVGTNARRVHALANIAPLAVLRERTASLPAAPWTTAATALAGLVVMIAYAYWKSNSWAVARSFGIGLIGAAAMVGAATALALKCLDWALPACDGLAWLPLRHGLLQLTRHRARSWVFLFTLSLGFSLLGALALVHHSLRAEILLGQAENAPDIFLVDIQKRQMPGVRALTRTHARGRAEFSPLVRARLTHINDAPIAKKDYDRLTLEERSRQRFLTREYNLTYKDILNASEKVVSGAFWSPGAAEPQISLERGFAERMRVGLGDRLRFDIQGRPLEAPVTSIRTIDWMSMKPNFFVVFPVRVLERAPQTFVGSFKLRGVERVVKFQRALLEKYPNVSTIDLADILQRIQSVLGVLLSALTGVAWFCVAIGLLVLAGTLTLGRRERSEAVALLRALGAERRTLVLIDAVYLATIGTLTCAISWGVSYGLGWFISRQMEVVFSSDTGEICAVAAAALLMPLAVGLLVQWRVYGTSVLAVLRREV